MRGRGGPSGRPAPGSAFGDDLHGDHRLHLVEELDAHLVGSDRTDRLLEVDVTPVDGHARLGRHGFRDICGGHRSEELALVTGARGDLQGARRDELRGERLELDLLLGQTSVVTPLERLGLLEGALLGPDRHASRDQIVACVAVRNLSDVPGVAELVDGLLKDDLHRALYGSRAISRAFFTAVATSRWCCTQLPVTRRARILPRSDTNLRSVMTSL